MISLKVHKTECKVSEQVFIKYECLFPPFLISIMSHLRGMSKNNFHKETITTMQHCSLTFIKKTLC